ncbi:MAG: hypothetical protein IT258_21710 [Saprospiraceae bacterium]|nr:hypothetical protein [Saprospiraceae bacterium]
MKSIKFFSFLLLFVLVAFASCKKEEINNTEVITDPVDSTLTVTNGLLTRSVADDDELIIGCVTIDYPYTLLLLDSTTVTINSDDEMNQLLLDSTNYPIDFVYPLNVTLADGTTQTVNNADELGALFAACIPTDWSDSTIVIGGGDYFPAWDISFENSCLQLVYPVSIVSQGNDPVTANNQDELISYLSDGNDYSFVFPISVESLDGTVSLVTEGGDLFDLLAACNTDPNGGGGMGGGCNPDGFACYQFSYPIGLVNADGSTTTVNNNDEFAVAIMSGGFTGFQFPLTLIAPDSTELVVNNDDELNNAMMSCFQIIDPVDSTTVVFGQYMCYDFVFPIQVIDVNGNTVSIADMAALESFSGTNFLIGFDYPLSLTKVETGEVVTVNSDEELNEAIEDCF